MKNWMWIILILALGFAVWHWWSKKKMVDDVESSGVLDALIDDIQALQQSIIDMGGDIQNIQWHDSAAGNAPPVIPAVVQQSESRH